MAKVLLVDDESSIRRTLKDILSFEKYEVVEAVDGLDGIEKVKQQSFDVILLDIMSECWKFKCTKDNNITAFRNIL